MPRTLFYAGVVFTLLAALMAGGEAWSHWNSESSVVDSGRSSPIRLLLLMVMVGPIGAIVVRIYAFLFARDLYASLSGLMMAGAAMSVAVGVVLVELQMSIVPEMHPMLAKVEWLGLYVLSFLCVGTVFTLRPYLRLRSPIASVLALIPAPLYVVMVAQDLRVLNLAKPVSSLYLASMASCLAAIGFHALRHRHAFVEPTNLRDVLEVRGSRPNTTRGRGFGIGHDAAFDG